MVHFEMYDTSSYIRGRLDEIVDSDITDLMRDNAHTIVHFFNLGLKAGPIRVSTKINNANLDEAAAKKITAAIRGICDLGAETGGHLEQGIRSKHH